MFAAACGCVVSSQAYPVSLWRPHTATAARTTITVSYFATARRISRSTPKNVLRLNSPLLSEAFTSACRCGIYYLLPVEHPSTVRTRRGLSFQSRRDFTPHVFPWKHFPQAGLFPLSVHAQPGLCVAIRPFSLFVEAWIRPRYHAASGTLLLVARLRVSLWFRRRKNPSCGAVLGSETGCLTKLIAPNFYFQSVRTLLTCCLYRPLLYRSHRRCAAMRVTASCSSSLPLLPLRRM